MHNFVKPHDSGYETLVQNETNKPHGRDYSFLVFRSNVDFSFVQCDVDNHRMRAHVSVKDANNKIQMTSFAKYIVVCSATGQRAMEQTFLHIASVQQ